MCNAPDNAIIKKNREYLDKYYIVNRHKDTVSNLQKTLRVLRAFGLSGLIKKMKHKTVHKIKYASDRTEEKCDAVHMDGKKIAVYTAIIGKYDNLIEPSYISPSCDYYIFTDMDVPEGGVWEKRDLPKTDEYVQLNNYQRAKYFKIFPHKFFYEYEYSIWVDGNISLMGDLSPFVQRMGEKNIAEFQHPNNNCIYDEAFSIVAQGKAKGNDVKKQIQAYKSKGFPRNFGLLENSFIVRRHHAPECVKLMDAWWRQMETYTWRDQLSLGYVLWETKLGFNAVYLLGPCWRWNPRLRQNDHV